MTTSFTFRDRVKIACLQSCISAGLDEDQMISVFQAATNRVRSGSSSDDTHKTAGTTSEILKTLGWLGGGLGLAALAAGAVGSGTLGYVGGKAARNIQVGRLPSPAEIKSLDEIALLNRTAEETRARLADEEEEKKRRAKPSSKRMF
jgi:hypothetical protein